MLKRRRSWFLLLAAVLFGGLLLYALWPREPSYAGRSLTKWLLFLEDIGDESSEYNEQVIRAFHAMCPGELPYLVKHLDEQKSWIRTKMEWINENFGRLVKIPLRRKPDAYAAATAFELLGTNAAPAVPDLTRLFLNTNTTEVAAFCLRQIGPVAVPVFVDGLTNQAVEVRQASFLHLTLLGPAARPAIPALESFVRGADGSQAALALQALSTIDPQPQRWLPVLASQMETNAVPPIAFSLSRLGADGIAVLVRHLNRQHIQTRASVLAAMRLELTNDFREQVSSFRGLVWRYEKNQGVAGATNTSVLVALNRGLEKADPPTRLMILTNVAACGTAALPVLAFAANDSESAVRETARRLITTLPFESRFGGIIRGPIEYKRLALVFTGHEYAEGAQVILETLAKHDARASFFLTGDFLANTNHAPVIRSITLGGHYLGPHSDKHLLYCSWESDRKTLITRDEFEKDLKDNNLKIEAEFGEPLAASPEARAFAQRYGLQLTPDVEPLVAPAIPPAKSPERPQARFFLPPYEHYNEQIALWTWECGMTLINFTPGTRSNADYIGEADKNFVDSKTIFDSIVAREIKDPHGLNGFLLLLHLGAGPGRIDKFHSRFPELVEFLQSRGYELVRVDELLQF